MAEVKTAKPMQGGPGMRGPGGRGMRGPRPKIKNPGKLFMRVMKYVFRDYGVHYVLVIACIFISVFASIQGTLFTKTLIDEYIKPFLLTDTPNFEPLARAIGRVAIFYAIGIVAGYTQSRIMINVTQGVLRNLRAF